MHHGNDEREYRELMDAKNQLNLGATGRFPEGRLNQNDEGEIQFGVAHDPATGKVIMNFGKPVAWIGCSAEQAKDLGECLIRHARDCRVIRRDNETQVKADNAG